MVSRTYKGVKIPSDVGRKGRYRILLFLLDNVGKIVSSSDIQKASGMQGQYGRRVRELRDEFGYQIHTSNDDNTIPVKSYKLVDPNPSKTMRKRTVSTTTRIRVFQRDGSVCQTCGATPGTIHPVTNRNTVLQVGHITDKSMGGSDDLSNLRTMCSVCNQGAKNILPEPTPAIKLLAQIRQGSEESQLCVLEFLAKKFHVYETIKHDIDTLHTLHAGAPARH